MAQPEGMGAGAPGGPEQVGTVGGARCGSARRSEGSARRHKGDARRGLRGDGSAGRELKAIVPMYQAIYHVGEKHLNLYSLYHVGQKYDGH